MLCTIFVWTRVFVPFVSVARSGISGSCVLKEMSTPQPEARALPHLGPARSSRPALPQLVTVAPQTHLNLMLPASSRAILRLTGPVRL